MKRFCWIFVALVAVVVVVACNRDKTESVKTQLDKLVTDAVINSAIESLAEDNYYVETEGATWTVCMKARHAVFQAKLGKDWFNELYASLAAANENDHTYNQSVRVDHENRPGRSRYAKGVEGGVCSSQGHRTRGCSQEWHREKGEGSYRRGFSILRRWGSVQ